MSDVFISYARSTEAQARKIAEALRALGYGVWRDDELPAHRAYSDVIEERLKAAKAVVVVWSAEAVKSHWVRAEADAAREAGTLVQLRVDAATPPMPFNQIQCADLVGWRGQADAPGWVKLLDSVAELVGGERQGEARASRERPPPRARSGVRVWAAAASVLVVLAAAAIGWVLVNRTASPLWGTRVAVLPLDTAGSGQDERSFADTLTDEIAGDLATNQIDAVPRADSMNLRGPGFAERLANLGVGLVLAGVVRSDGHQFSVRMNLEDPRSQATLWSRNFVQPAQGAETLETQIAGRVAEVTEQAVSPRVQALRNSPGLLAEYLEAVDAKNDDQERTLALSRDLVVRAPRFAVGHAMLARAIQDNFFDLSPDTRPQAAAEAAREAKEALALDPSLPEAYIALAEGAPFMAWSKREELLKKGLSLQPNNVDGNLHYSFFLDQVGRTRDALVAARLARTGDPFSPYARWSVASAQGLVGEHEDAVATIEDAKQDLGDSAQIAEANLEVAAWSGSPSQLLAVSNDPWVVGLYRVFGPGALRVVRTGAQARASGGSAERRAAAGIVIEAAEDGALSSMDAVVTLAALGDLDGAFRTADQLLAAAPVGEPAATSQSLNTRPLFSPTAAPLRRDPRFMVLANRLGLVDYWRSTGHWPDFCSEPGLPYRCQAEAEAAKVTTAHG